jgi:hypothetical protein
MRLSSFTKSSGKAGNPTTFLIETTLTRAA